MKEEEETNEKLDMTVSENEFAIDNEKPFDSKTSNTDNPFLSQQSQEKSWEENIEEEEATFGRLESLSSSVLDEIFQGQLTVARIRSPLPDGTRRRLIEHSIRKDIVRTDYPRVTPVLVVEEIQSPQEAEKRPSFEARCRELNIKIDEGLRRIEGAGLNRQKFWERTERQRKTVTAKPDGERLIQATPGGPQPTCSLLEMRNRDRKKKKAISQKRNRYRRRARAPVVPTTEDDLASDAAIAAALQLEEDEAYATEQMRMSTLREDDELVRERWMVTAPHIEASEDENQQVTLEQRISLPPLPTVSNPFILKDKHLRLRNVYKVPGVKMVNYAPTGSIAEAAKSSSPKKEKGERRLRTSLISRDPSRRKPGSPLRPKQPQWPCDTDLSRMLHSRRTDLRPLEGQPGLLFTRDEGDEPVLALEPLPLGGKNGDVGPSWTSDENTFNLLSESQLYRFGVSVVKSSREEDAGLYLEDIAGQRFPFRMEGNHFRVDVGFAKGGKVESASFIIDGGCPHHLIKSEDAERLQGGSGDMELTLGSFSKGCRHEVHGGDPWYVCLKDSRGQWRAPRTKVTHLPGPVTHNDMSSFLVEAQACVSNALPRSITESNEKGGSTTASIGEGTRDDGSRPKETARGGNGSVIGTKESALNRRMDNSNLISRKMNLSKDSFNDMVKRGYFDDQDVVQLESESTQETIDKLLAGGSEPPRVRSRKVLAAKERTEVEPFHLVFCDGFEGLDEVGAHVTGHRYILRFVDYASGIRKSYSCATKDKFSQALQMFLAWIQCIAPIIEKHRNLPPGHIRCRVLCSDRDSNMVTIVGDRRTKFDDITVEHCIHRYFADTADSDTASAVEATFATSIKRAEKARLQSGLPERFAMWAWLDDEDKFAYRPTTANALGRGESPNATLGLSMNINKFQPFGCVGTVYLKNKGLYRHNDGSISKSPPANRIGDGQGGKVSRVKNLPCFYLRAGGGLTTNEFNGKDFGGWLVYVPALDNSQFRGGGLMATRRVTWHPRLKALRNPDTGMTKDVTQADSVLTPEGTGIEIRVAELVKVIPVEFGKIVEFNMAANAEHENDVNERLTFLSSAVNHIMPTTKEPTFHAQTQVDGETIDGHQSDDEPCCFIEGHGSNVGVSWSGQRSLELESHEGGREPKRGQCDGVSVELMQKGDARLLIARALSRADVRFEWYPGQRTHRKRGISGDRQEYYMRHVKNREDYRRVRKLPWLVGRKKTIVHADLVNDVCRGLLGFSFGAKDGDTQQEIICDEMLVEGEEEGTLHRVLLARPDLKSPDECNVFELWRRLAIPDLSVNELRSLATAQFVLTVEDAAPNLNVSQQKPPEDVKTLREAMDSPNWHIWEASIKRELEGLRKRGTWTEVKRSAVPAGYTILPSHLIFKVKYLASGEYDKAKSRLVAGGHRAIADVHYFNSSSHMVTAAAMRMLTGLSCGEWGANVERLIKSGVTREKAITMSECYKLHSIDITQAYIVASWPDNHPDIYMELPSLNREKAKNQFVAKMDRMLYGLPDSGRNFERYFDRFLRESCGAVPMVADRSVYKIHTKSGDVVYCAVFVDDAVFWGTSDGAVAAFRSAIRAEFGADGFTGGEVAESILGLKVEYNDAELHCTLSMPGYISAVAERFSIDERTRPPSSPLPLNHEDKKNEEAPLSEERRKLFQQIVGCAGWASFNAKPEAMIATSYLAQHCHNPSEEHLKLGYGLIGYLNKTRNQGIRYHGSSKVLNQGFPRRNKLDAYVDANLGGDAFDERSRSCYVIQLNGGMIAMKIMKQPLVARSTGHSEMRALAMLAQQLQFCTDIMSELGYGVGSVRCLEDNASVCLQSGGDSQAAKSGHYRRDQAYVDEFVNAGKMYVDKVDTKLNIADLGTKAVSNLGLFEDLRDRLTGYNPECYISPTVEKAMNRKLFRSTPRQP